MEIRHFITLKKIIEYGSFSLAAEHMGYTQSTVTSHIQALESHLNTPVFDRIGRRVQLTEAGKKLLQYADEILKTYEKIEHITESNGTVTGELKIAAPESLTVYRLEPILKEYRSAFPHVRVKLSNATCGDNKKALLSGEADIAFMMWPELTEEDLIVTPLSEEPIVLVGSIEHPLNLLTERSHPNRLDDCLIANEKDCSYRTLFEAYLRQRNLHPTHIMELWSIEAIKRCVSSGLGIAYLPLICVEEELKNNQLKTIAYEGTIPKIYSHMVHHKNKWLSPALSGFIQLTKKHAQTWATTSMD
ncbi:LysR family transcriptional regulator [Paenibacillus radicis (ex Gao et al. 2016)]|uniref:LysR family transcriptional regulator n=1 Tax=Paenibacillus radicis (ex Gao et al. 2016) TaxID=1737354 RepID=A0A917H6F2_9BACL|nr:LysR family transcriptional regulator [Paenibacillus radicis (ex Gao et al. 2016)]GGG68582.1 LysR family transcriptional regulator [Paenibacillus radicis (ex Gao et al. 2016)]